MSFFPTQGPFVMAHRGFSPDGLENSMAAFEAATHLGIAYLETDVHATADGRLVAFHDHDLDRVTDRAGAIATLPWAVVSAAKIGGREPIPLLEQVLGDLPGVCLNIDVKSMSAVRPLVDVLGRTNAYDRVCIASFSDRRRQAVLRRLPRPVATSAGMIRTGLFWAGHRLGGLGAALRWAGLHGIDALQVPHRHGPMVVDADFVARAHEAGVQVHLWDVDEEVDMHEMLDLGVDCLITDQSERALKVLESRQR